MNIFLFAKLRIIITTFALNFVVYMSLREHLVLKYISILLFCLGLLAPTIACTFQPNSNKETTGGKVLSITHAVTLNSLFAEKEIEEERDGKSNSGLGPGE